MSKIYFTGLNASSLINSKVSEESATISAVDSFVQIADKDINNIEIGWDYFLIWKRDKLYIGGKLLEASSEKPYRSLQIPTLLNQKFKQAIPGSGSVTVLMDNNDIWIYNIYNDSWMKVEDFITKVDDENSEYIVKIAKGRCTVALTNLGRAYNIPLPMNVPDHIKFIDIACGYDHTLLLADNGDVYSTGMGTRGQLGHGDLEDCDEPRLIEALEGLKAIQISAGGWHSVVVTDQGDLYTWGWNNQGQLGHPDVENVVALPKVVDFGNEEKENIDINIAKVECGSAFTICRTDNGDLWGCGCNKYGQLGKSMDTFPIINKFITLDLGCVEGNIGKFKCREWGTCIYVT